VRELVLFAFRTETGAQEMGQSLTCLQGQEQIELYDSATIVYRRGGLVTIDHGQSTGDENALSDAFWGTLAGLIMSLRVLNPATGARQGALSGSFADMGVDDQFVVEFREAMQPGRSVMLLLVDGRPKDGTGVWGEIGAQVHRKPIGA
jgi:uncharacterized membrane protein